ncbi:MAG TPA: mechanosensitive ion channel domain-containing protein [Steroidobacteraceae bacterium]|nr:mechanosensitive ion channel domain-containing protein [Steroidobacteraceae bacterium]
MSALQKIVAAVLAALLLASLYGLWHTAAAPTPVLRAADAANTNVVPVIDQNTLITAQRLARLADTPEEQPLAQQAVQLADHELDLAFSGALRHLEVHPPVLSDQAQQIQARLTAAQKQLATSTDQVNRLKTQLEKASEADKPGLQDQLDLAQSQLELQQDEVAEAEHDLLDAGGNVHQRIQLAEADHAAAEKNAAAPPTVKPASPVSILHGMVEQVRQWWALREKRHWILEAQQRASESAEQLLQTRHKLAAEVASTRHQLGGVGEAADELGLTPPLPARVAATAGAAATSAGAGAGGPGASPPSLLSITRQAAADQRRLTLRDQRITTRRKLADVYAKWADVVATQERAALHACLVSAAIILAALLVLLYADRWVGGLIARAPIIDRRQLGALRSVVGVALQVVGILVIVFVLVGRPSQLGTMIGLATAGLTVALKGFIVSFIGWFVLMGRNGIRIGDWVEINGVSGEVVELGMFHTVLRETGNWTDAGHPTGRQVTFTNAYAIEGHYFNFSTSGQWLWDELTVTVPYGRDSHKVAEEIQKEVVAATSQSTAQAQAEWQAASRGERGTAVSTDPSVALRPVPGGVEIAVRYVTRVSERIALRGRLSQAAVQTLAAQTASP